jgi:coenzyme F420-reducing hydrogenase beta subunit
MKDRVTPQQIVNAGLCIGCGSCVSQAAVAGATMKFDKYGQLIPTGPKSWMNKPSESFYHTCPFSPGAVTEDILAAELFPLHANASAGLGRYEKAYVGHVAEDDYRMQGSSGGMVTWVATELLKRGLIDGVAHVVASEDPQAEGNFFHYRISRTEEDIRAGAKSRYYPSEVSGILQTIRDVPGRYAVVGIPCFIKAVQLLRRQDPVIRERVRFTLGLFCGHMKSARFIESFAWQLNVPAKEVSKVEFRYKDASRPANWYNARLTLRDGTIASQDWWHLADGDWGAGFFMNSACNYCDDVMAETADISFGDAWVEPYSSDGKGTNVVVIRSPLVEELVTAAIADGRLELQEASDQLVEQTQAAGLRQRREGVAYRMDWNPPPVKPVKRFNLKVKEIPKTRKLIYRMRYWISKWSHRMFWLAKKINQPQVYIRWARMASAMYHGLAYHRGKLGQAIKRLGLN